MNNRNVILIVLLILVVVLAVVGIVLGVTFYRNNKNGNNSNKKNLETFNLTLEDMYCNIKDSKKIVKVKITIETNNKETLELLEKKQFLIRDDINKIIRNKTEEELQGEEGQIKLQKEIKESLIKLFNDETITNVYFDDLIIQ
ncbi:flagellar FliL protein [Keratinibaculum paraultunense]|uniref:Flagellar protein FliL n=1 Tax=Keratinibaculum paraultunense TaxID=1278232 RepID=A0A4V2UU85_9FIRM|nr:flagellar basal body-associated FliL family protein [Keratinibaculum paraultunense]QQY80727.1 flagellar basal body-associated FliL family protein [Keratinibaculum paraultunense]TCS89665.1 flagellar FliL protein [Keratinibaculum paraultunense]